ncbi:oligosaccharide flippase family protein [Paracoccus sp. Z118]|uniref:oligosaccharide flippase family protein n=1 Tax=Paracoccus sp. Z118 TaxID=2851017 RepID=UPI001C2B9EC1|nr:oligosaccharide flippase family protein [Paracoccus sp. Z118]MBV0891406.1 oligosaccharide flippase family protein [Paracoccus sp. Z118]
MLAALTRIRHGQGLSQRVVRGAAWTIIGVFGSQGTRLVSNLILTRLLFPEVFGIMALIMVVITALNNFSDVGVAPAVLRSERGDDPAFLDTAFTLQAIRGVGLWLACCALAVPVAWFYDVPELAWYLPVAGFSSVIWGVLTTRIEQAQRHLHLGRLTRMEIYSQILATILTVALAAVWQSAWGLVVALVFGAVIKLVIADRMLPGHRNRFRWDPAAAREIIDFGKWIFPSTIVGFILAQGDKAILGKYLTLAALGLYNIAFFLATVAQQLGGTVIGRIMMPIYRESPPKGSRENFLRIRRIRMTLTAGFLAVLAIVAALGPWLVDVLYDARYEPAGEMVRLIACATIPQMIVLGYDHAALVAGDSRRYFALTAIRAALFLALFWLGVHLWGLVGGLGGQALAAVLAYPATVWLARRHGAWDPLHDVLAALAGLAIVAAFVRPGQMTGLF